MERDYSRFVKEFLACIPAAEPLQDVLVYILSDLASKNFQVWTRTDGEHSVTSITESPRKLLIRIDITCGTAQQPLNPLWELIHEWGHVLKGPVDPATRKTCEHENSVWELAWMKLLNHFALAEYESAYHEHQLYCVETYSHGR